MKFRSILLAILVSMLFSTSVFAQGFVTPMSGGRILIGYDSIISAGVDIAPNSSYSVVTASGHDDDPGYLSISASNPDLNASFSCRIEEGAYMYNTLVTLANYFGPGKMIEVTQNGGTCTSILVR